MKISTTTGLVGFLLALSALNKPGASARVERSQENTVTPTIEERLAAIEGALRQRENQLQNSFEAISSPQSNREEWVVPASLRKFLQAGISWGNSQFRDRGGVGWNNGGGFVKWPDSWRDGGGFVNFRR